MMRIRLEPRQRTPAWLNLLLVLAILFLAILFVRGW